VTGAGVPPAWGLRDHGPDTLTEYVSRGWWTDDTVGSFAANALNAGAAHGRNVTVLHRKDTACLSQREVLDAARRFAGGMRDRGIRAGDVVAFQLPNSVEAAITFYGLALLGAVAVPVVTFYGPKELAHILNASHARAFIAGASLVPQAPRADFETVRAPAANVELLIAGHQASGATLWSELLGAEPIRDRFDVDPNAPALLAYTSGTTQPEPKGVVHSHRTLLAEVRQLAVVQPDEPPPIIGAPVGHAIGLLGALLVPIALGRSVFLADGWNPRRILQEMLACGVPAGTGSPYFLTSLLDHADFTDAHRELIRYVGLGGAPVPPEVIERCRALDISVVRMYGLTEHPSVSGASHADPPELRATTDGRLLDGVEVRIVNDDGNDLGFGQRGEILTRGPDRCLGFVDEALARECLDRDGWLHTGDVGVLTEAGWLTILDRKKDLIIKGGENIGPGEIEMHVGAHPDIAEVAVVGVPDARVGERVCAFVRVQPGAAAPELPALHRFLRANGLGLQKWPDEVRVVEDFPRTPSGKIKKAELRGVPA
jgi:acyl-CoA synthetase (AMP-forming)/AMP-acid ligase II